MSIVLEVPSELESRLRTVAQQRGWDVSRYVLELISERVEGEGADALTLEEAAQMLSAPVSLVQRMLERGDLVSLHPALVLAEKRRREAAQRALDEIVALTEAAQLYDHQRDEPPHETSP